MAGHRRSPAAMAALLLLLLASATAVEEVEAAASTTATAEPDVEALVSTIAKMQRLLAALPSTSTTVAERELELDGIQPADAGGYRIFIVLLQPPEGGQDADADAAMAWHMSFLPSETTAQGKRRLVHSYRRVFTGFAAWLTEEELKEMAAKPGFIRAYNNYLYHSQTTHTLL